METIYSTDYAFAAKLVDGSVVTWGDARYGGSCKQQAKLKDVETIYSNNNAFAAKLVDGRVVTWGDARYGGSCKQQETVKKGEATNS